MVSKNIKEEDFIYSQPPKSETISFLGKFDSYLTLFAERNNIEREAIFYNIPLLIDIFTRIDKRQDYYQYFHSEKNKTTHMSQAKEMALLCN